MFLLSTLHNYIYICHPEQGALWANSTEGRIAESKDLLRFTGLLNYTRSFDSVHSSFVGMNSAQDDVWNVIRFLKKVLLSFEGYPQPQSRENDGVKEIVKADDRREIRWRSKMEKNHRGAQGNDERER